MQTLTLSVLNTCHRGEFCIPASRILAVKLNRNTIGMPAFFKQPYRRWNVGPTPELVVRLHQGCMRLRCQLNLARFGGKDQSVVGDLTTL